MKLHIFIKFIDRFSHFMCVSNFHKLILYWFGPFESRVENQIMKVEILRTIWECESLSQDINDLSNEREILIKLTILWSSIIIWSTGKKKWNITKYDEF